MRTILINEARMDEIVENTLRKIYMKVNHDDYRIVHDEVERMIRIIKEERI